MNLVPVPWDPYIDPPEVEVMSRGFALWLAEERAVRRGVRQSVRVATTSVYTFWLVRDTERKAP